MPINVILDTSAILAGSDGAEYQRICDLAQMGVIKVYIPEVAANEVRANLRAPLEKAHQTALQSLYTIGRSEIARDSHLAALAQETREKLAAFDLDALVDAGAAAKWKSMDATIVPLAPDHGSRVMSAYFDGAPPYPAERSRKDIPDSFVYETAVDLAKTLESPLHVVSTDGNLSSHLARIPGLTAHTSYGSLLEHKDVTGLVSKIQREAQWKVQFIDAQRVLPATEDLLVKLLEDADFEPLFGRYVYHRQIPEDNNEAMIDYVEDIHDVDFDWGSTRDVGPGKVLVRARFSCVADTSFRIYRADALLAPPGVYVTLGDFETEHYFDAGGSLVINVTALLLLSIEEGEIAKQSPANVISVEIDKVEGIEVEEGPRESIFEHGRI